MIYAVNTRTEYGKGTRGSHAHTAGIGDLSRQYGF